MLQGRRRLHLYGAHRSAGILMTLNPRHVSGAVLAIRVQKPTSASSLDARHEGAHVVFLIGWHITPVMSPALKVEQRAAQQVQPGPRRNPVACFQGVHDRTDERCQGLGGVGEAPGGVIGKRELEYDVQVGIRWRAYDIASHADSQPDHGDPQPAEA